MNDLKLSNMLPPADLDLLDAQGNPGKDGKLESVSFSLGIQTVSAIITR